MGIVDGHYDIYSGTQAEYPSPPHYERIVPISAEPCWRFGTPRFESGYLSLIVNGA